MLIVSPAGTNIPEAHIDTAAEMNRDGFGWAMVTKWNEIETFKSMNLTEAKRSFYKAREKNPDGDAMFHLRIATDGTVDTFNCHPFYVGNDERTMLAHNGILPVRPEKYDPRSDTHILAQDLLPKIGLHALDDEAWIVEMEKWIRGSKVAILSTDPILKKYLYILNEKDGDWDGGVWYSNNMYQGWYYDHAYGGYIYGGSSYGRSYSTGWGGKTSVVTSTKGITDRMSAVVADLELLNWPKSADYPLPKNGYTFGSDETQVVLDLGLDVMECSFCGADVAYEAPYMPHVCPVCSMDPMENAATGRSDWRELSKPADTQPTRPDHFPSGSHIEGTMYVCSGGTFVYSVEYGWVDEATYEAWAAAEKDFTATVAAATSATDDVVYAQANTDADFLKTEEARVGSSLIIIDSK